SSPNTATTQTYSLSLHDALPICLEVGGARAPDDQLLLTRDGRGRLLGRRAAGSKEPDSRAAGDQEAPSCDGHGAPPLCAGHSTRSEEHTSELQSRGHLVCRLLPE